MQMDLFGYTKNEPQQRSTSCFGKNGIVTLRGDEIFLSPKQLADKIGYHVQTMYTWKRKDGMPVRQAKVRGRWNVEWHEFCEWWKQKKV